MRQSKPAGQVRIISGQWRGRKLPVPELAGLRPTGDRVRETLFNWLQADIAGRHCLDLFAGSGALGFEALSRHAASLTLVEPAGTAFNQLRATATLLGHESIRLEKNTAERFLSVNRQRFDIVFIDPPFEHAVQWEIMASLVPHHLSPGARIYVEAPSRQELPSSWPQGFSAQREKRFGDVIARLMSFIPE